MLASVGTVPKVPGSWVAVQLEAKTGVAIVPLRATANSAAPRAKERARSQPAPDDFSAPLPAMLDMVET
jgi:hypothetical protein